MAQSSNSTVRKALKSAGSNKDPLKLIQHPERFAKEAGLSESDSASLRSADLVIAVVRDPLALNTTQTTHPVTITAVQGAFNTGDPLDLDDLDKNALYKCLTTVSRKSRI